jgi:hypothetical protein
MNHAKPLLTSVDAAALSQRQPARMPLRAEQHSLIAGAYEKAAADANLPVQTRAAFAKKADWFRLLACVGEKRERALMASEAKQPEAPPDPFWCVQGQGEADLKAVLVELTASLARASSSATVAVL